MFANRTYIKKLLGLGFLPRWIVLLIDLNVLFLSFLATVILFKSGGYHYVLYDQYLMYGTMYLSSNLFAFWVFRTYAGIIRHSSIEDAGKMAVSQLMVMIFLLGMNTVYELYFQSKLVMETAVITNALVSFCTLLFYRLTVKFVYENYFSGKLVSRPVRVIIYGTDTNAISVASALRAESPARFAVVGFIDKDGQHESKRILNIPIFSKKRKLPVIMRFIGGEGVILADKSMNRDEMIAWTDLCLKEKIKVYTAPLVADLDNQQQISKQIKNIQIEDLLGRKSIVLDDTAISNTLKGKNILITGAAGSIGSEIVRQVVRFQPKEMILLDQAETPLYQIGLEMQQLQQLGIMHQRIVDVRNLQKLQKVFEEFHIDVVFHAAAYKHVPLMEENPTQAIENNVQGTKNLADLSCRFGVNKFVMVSTDKAVNPSNVMGASKRIAEKYVQSLYQKEYLLKGEGSTKFVTTRFGNVLGSNGSVVPLFTKQIADGGPITITHPEIIRYFMTIPEACQLVLEAGAMGKGGEIFIFDMGKPVKIVDLAYKMIQLAGLTPEEDIKIKFVGLRPGEKLYEELLHQSAITSPTHHKKIMIAQDPIESYDEVATRVNKLIAMQNDASNEEIVAMMKKIVPEFISKNSAYQLLDK